MVFEFHSTEFEVANVLVSGLFAGLVAIGVSVVIEKCGGVIGGVIGGLPSTIVTACIGIALQQYGNDAELIDACFSVPMGMFYSVSALYTWKLVPPYLGADWPIWRKRHYMCTIRAPYIRTIYHRKLLTMLGVSLSVWALLAGSGVFLVGALKMIVDVRVLGILSYVSMILIGLAASFRLTPAPQGKNRVSPWMYLARGLAAGTAISTAVAVVKINATLGAIVSTFPAIFLTSMIGIWISQGEACPIGAIAPLMLGVSAVSLFAMSFGVILTTPLLSNAPLGAAIAFAVVASWTIGATANLPSYFWLKWRRRAAEAKEVKSQNNKGGSSPGEGFGVPEEQGEELNQLQADEHSAEQKLVTQDTCERAALEMEGTKRATKPNQNIHKNKNKKKRTTGHAKARNTRKPPCTFQQRSIPEAVLCTEGIFVTLLKDLQIT